MPSLPVDCSGQWVSPGGDSGPDRPKRYGHAHPWMEMAGVVLMAMFLHEGGLLHGERFQSDAAGQGAAGKDG